MLHILNKSNLFLASFSWLMEMQRDSPLTISGAVLANASLLYPTIVNPYRCSLKVTRYIITGKQWKLDKCSLNTVGILLKFKFGDNRIRFHLTTMGKIVNYGSE